MKKKLDFILEQDEDERLVFRFHPRSSHCHSFNETPPKTWEELKSAAEKLTTKDRYGIVLPVEKTAYTLFNWWPFMWMDDADIYDADGNVTAGKDSMADALDFWGSFYQN